MKINGTTDWQIVLSEIDVPVTRKSETDRAVDQLAVELFLN